MIIFDLSCNDNHRFEGWFRSSEEFSSQQTQQLVSCPHCGSTEIRRVPSALHVGNKSAEIPRATSPQPAAPAAGAASHPLAMLKAAVENLISNTEDVGTRFAEEARRIHYQETPARAIRGQASKDEYSALKEEGISVIMLPSVKPEDMN
ncbi:MAG: DUF1178 family protein [Zoogloeaceae bacterium]|nr:DUF1178 family protein [Zoogloeaceae bacterium]